MIIAGKKQSCRSAPEISPAFLMETACYFCLCSTGHGRNQYYDMTRITCINIHKHRRKNKPMKMEQWIRAIAGVFILISVGLGYFHHRYWLFFTAFVGLNLLQSAFTKWCLMEDILKKLGVAGKS